MEQDWKEVQCRFKPKTRFDALSIDSMAEQMVHTHVEEQPEDDAMKAVRQALQACALGIEASPGV